MCDKIPLLESAIRMTETDIDHLTELLKKCKENTKKKYKCYLISDQINDKKKTMDALKESLQKNTELCTMYEQIGNGSN